MIEWYHSFQQSNTNTPETVGSVSLDTWDKLLTMYKFTSWLVVVVVVVEMSIIQVALSHCCSRYYIPTKLIIWSKIVCELLACSTKKIQTEELFNSSNTFLRLCNASLYGNISVALKRHIQIRFHTNDIKTRCSAIAERPRCRVRYSFRQT